jgi:hypothetical protein
MAAPVSEIMVGAFFIEKQHFGNWFCFHHQVDV